MHEHAHAAVKHAPVIVDTAAALAAAVTKLVADHNAVVGAARTDEQHGLRDDAANLAAVSDFILSQLVTAGLPVRLPRGTGLSLVDTAAAVVTMVETLS